MSHNKHQSNGEDVDLSNFDPSSGLIPNGQEVAVKKLSVYSRQDKEKSTVLNWATRYRIIIGIARGLLYLHEEAPERIIHRDIKASNILLDDQLNPKISDFGLARLFPGEGTHLDTLKISGTYGYMAPEYAMQGYLSVKSDVFSFGVVTLEIVSGRKNIVEQLGAEKADLLSYVSSFYFNIMFFH
ncbi:hypothetical protein RDABS01_017270 [Bienertia sinuspersici]